MDAFHWVVTAVSCAFGLEGADNEEGAAVFREEERERVEACRSMKCGVE